MCILTIAFPMSVAPKNVQNGIKKWPHVIPTRSKNGFGIEANSKMQKNSTRLTIYSIQSLIFFQNALKNMSFSQWINNGFSEQIELVQVPLQRLRQSFVAKKFVEIFIFWLFTRKAGKLVP